MRNQHYRDLLYLVQIVIAPISDTSTYTDEMTATTYPEFHQDTEGLEVAEKFAREIRGRTILVTGVNAKGIGFSTSQAFVSSMALDC